MKQYRSLIRVTLGNSFKTFRNSVSRKSNSAAMAFLLIAFLVIVFCFLFASTGTGLALVALKYAVQGPVFTLAAAGLSLLLLFFAVIYIFSLMYYSKDNEFLLSLPVKNSTIFLSKITVIYILLEVIGGVMLIPLGIAYGVSLGLGAGFYFGLLLTQIVLPLCPIFLAVLLSFPLMYVISFIRKSRILSMVMVFLGIALFAGVYVGIFLIGGSVGGGAAGGLVELTDQMVAMIRNLAGGLVFYNAVSQMFIAGVDVLTNLGIFLACNFAFAAFSFLLAKVLYRRGMSKQLEASSEVIKVNQAKRYKTSSPMKAMLKKDLKFMIRTPIVLFNLLIELVLPVIFIIIMSISLRPVMESSNPAAAEMAKYIMVVFCTLFGLTFACGLNFMAISTVSREGQSFYIMKMIPVPIYKQLEVRANFAFLLPFSSIVLLAAVAFGMGIMEIQSAMMYLVFTSILAYGFTYYQVGLDVKRPKLDWDNITQLTHNNINTMKCMGISFLINLGISAIFIGGLLLIGMFAGYFVAELITWTILIILAILITFAFKRNFAKRVLYDFEHIEV